MLELLFVAGVVALKVFKKTTPNGKFTVYLGKRDFIDHLDHIDPIDGVIVIDNDYLKGRKLYGQVLTTYRYGREEDEVMGLKFSKEMVLSQNEIVPGKEKQELTALQDKLLKRLGPNAFPFTFRFPKNAPSSVILQPGSESESDSKPLGVEYAVKAFVGENIDDKSHKRSTVSLAIKKLQYAPVSRGLRLPSSLVSKSFTFSSGKLCLEVTLDKEIFYHGEGVGVNVVVSNNSRKSVRNIKVSAVQHTEVTMVNAQFSRHVAMLESREGCPITPGATLTKTFFLVPNASTNKDRYGVALDGYLKDEDVNLASSTLVPEGKSAAEALGIIISYSVRVRLDCGTLGGDLTTDVPFKLMHPAPGVLAREKANILKRMKSMKSLERAKYESGCYASEDDNIVFEDFSRLRLNEPE